MPDSINRSANTSATSHTFFHAVFRVVFLHILYADMRGSRGRALAQCDGRGNDAGAVASAQARSEGEETVMTALC